MAMKINQPEVILRTEIIRSVRASATSSATI